MTSLEDYLPIVGNEVIANLHQKARPLYGRRICQVNSTYQGGGVAEILERLVPLMNDLGMEVDWRVLPGPLDFFSITKKFHNALQGEEIELTDDMKQFYLDQNRAFSEYARLDFDLVYVHDPQPLPLVRYYRRRQPWLWQCHVDLTEPYRPLWDFLTRYILRYDAMVISSGQYAQTDLWLKQVVFTPAIDPLSLKNADMDEDTVAMHLGKMKIPTDKPFVLQVSRFDKWKDMSGLVDVFRKVREAKACRLVLTGSTAADDPEGMEMYSRTIEAGRDLIESGDLIVLSDRSNAEVNALQRAAAVVTQKSKREGFGLTVTEAMWKARPVVATCVGGIQLQIDDGVNGLMVDPLSDDAFAEAILKLLNEPDLGREFGIAAKEKVRREFLITRLLGAYLDLYTETLS